MSREGVQVPPGEITRIVKWGIPLCIQDAQSFIRVLNFHRDHISKFGQEAYGGVVQTRIWISPTSGRSDGEQESVRLLDCVKLRVTNRSEVELHMAITLYITFTQ